MSKLRWKLDTAPSPCRITFLWDGPKNVSLKREHTQPWESHVMTKSSGPFIWFTFWLISHVNDWQSIVNHGFHSNLLVIDRHFSPTWSMIFYNICVISTNCLASCNLYDSMFTYLIHLSSVSVSASPAALFNLSITLIPILKHVFAQLFSL